MEYRFLYRNMLMCIVHSWYRNLMMYLEQDDVQLRQEVQGQCDVGGEREADAGRDHLDKKI